VPSSLLCRRKERPPPEKLAAKLPTTFHTVLTSARTESFNPSNARDLLSSQSRNTLSLSGSSDLRASCSFRAISAKGILALMSSPPKNKNGVPTISRHRPCYSPSEINFFNVPTAVETLASRDAAADSPVADPGHAQVEAQTNGSRVRYARADHCHSTARAAAAVPGYR
jgi:hypothetical protein